MNSPARSTLSLSPTPLQGAGPYAPKILSGYDVGVSLPLGAVVRVVKATTDGAHIGSLLYKDKARGRISKVYSDGVRSGPALSSLHDYDNQNNHHGLAFILVGYAPYPRSREDRNSLLHHSEQGVRNLISKKLHKKNPPGTPFGYAQTIEAIRSAIEKVKSGDLTIEGGVAGLETALTLFEDNKNPENFQIIAQFTKKNITSLLMARGLSKEEAEKDYDRRAIKYEKKAAPPVTVAPVTPAQATRELKKREVTRGMDYPEALEVIAEMVQRLAALPEPGPGYKADGVGFSGVTNSPLRAYNNLVRGREDKTSISPDVHYRAAALLIHHSNTQVSKEDLFSAIRAIEEKVALNKRIKTKKGKPLSADMVRTDLPTGLGEVAIFTQQQATPLNPDQGMTNITAQKVNKPAWDYLFGSSARRLTIKMAEIRLKEKDQLEAQKVIDGYSWPAWDWASDHTDRWNNETKSVTGQVGWNTTPNTIEIAFIGWKLALNDYHAINSFVSLMEKRLGWSPLSERRAKATYERDITGEPKTMTVKWVTYPLAAAMGVAYTLKQMLPDNSHVWDALARKWLEKAGIPAVLAGIMMDAVDEYRRVLMEQYSYTSEEAIDALTEEQSERFWLTQSNYHSFYARYKQFVLPGGGQLGSRWYVPRLYTNLGINTIIGNRPWEKAGGTSTRPFIPFAPNQDLWQYTHDNMSIWQPARWIGGDHWDIQKDRQAYGGTSSPIEGYSGPEGLYTAPLQHPQGGGHTLQEGTKILSYYPPSFYEELEGGNQDVLKLVDIWEKPTQSVSGHDPSKLRVYLGTEEDQKLAKRPRGISKFHIFNMPLFMFKYGWSQLVKSLDLDSSVMTGAEAYKVSETARARVQELVDEYEPFRTFAEGWTAENYLSRLDGPSIDAIYQISLGLERSPNAHGVSIWPSTFRPIDPAYEWFYAQNDPFYVAPNGKRPYVKEAPYRLAGNLFYFGANNRKTLEAKNFIPIADDDGNRTRLIQTTMNPIMKGGTPNYTGIGRFAIYDAGARLPRGIVFQIASGEGGRFAKPFRVAKGAISTQDLEMSRHGSMQGALPNFNKYPKEEFDFGSEVMGYETPDADSVFSPFPTTSQPVKAWQSLGKAFAVLPRTAGDDFAVGKRVWFAIPTEAMTIVPSDDPESPIGFSESYISPGYSRKLQALGNPISSSENPYLNVMGNYFPTPGSLDSPTVTSTSQQAIKLSLNGSKSTWGTYSNLLLKDIKYVPAAARFFESMGWTALAWALRLKFMRPAVLKECGDLKYLSGAPTWESILEGPAEEMEARRGVYEKAKALTGEIKARKYDEATGAYFKPFKFQEIGIAYGIMTGGQEGDTRVLIGDTMGLGKTIQALGIISVNPEKYLPAIIVCPKNVEYNWMLETQEWLGHLGVTVENYSNTNQPLPPADVIVIGWGKMGRSDDVLNKVRAYEGDDGRGIQTMIVDEAHYGKNLKSNRSKEMREVAHAVPNLILLTGTAMENRPAELWPLLNAIDPVTWPKAKDFVGRYASLDPDARRGKTAKQLEEMKKTRISSFGEMVDPDAPAVDAAELLKQELECVMIRRLKEDVPEIELPIKTKITYEVDLRNEDRADYEKFESEIAQYIALAYKRKLLKEAVKSVKAGAEWSTALATANEILSPENLKPDQLAQVRLAVINYLRNKTGSIKVPYAVDWILDYLDQDYAFDVEEGEVPPNKPLLVWFGFKENGRRLKQALLEARPELEGRIEVIDGDVPSKKRSVIASRFNRAGKTDPQTGQPLDPLKIVIATKAAREGLTMTGGTDALFVEYWWVPAWLEQAEARIWRIGQEEPVRIHYMNVPQTTDDLMRDILQAKSSVIQETIGEDTAETEQEEAELEKAIAQLVADSFREQTEAALAELAAGDIEISLEEFQEAIRDAGLTVTTFRYAPRLIAAGYSSAPTKIGSRGLVANSSAAKLNQYLFEQREASLGQVLQYLSETHKIKGASAKGAIKRLIKDGYITQFEKPFDLFRTNSRRRLMNEGERLALRFMRSHLRHNFGKVGLER